jgi:hypothetical protein
MPALNEINVLAYVPGQYVAAAANLLPAPETAATDVAEVTIEVPGGGHGGLFRIAFRRMTHRRGKMSRTFWCAESAVSLL